MTLSPPSSSLGPGTVTAGDLTSAALMRYGILQNGAGILSDPFPATAVTSQSVLATGTVYCLAIGLRSGDTVTNILCNVTTPGTSTAPTLIRLGVSDSTGKMLAVTADVHASAAFTAGGTPAIPLTGALPITADGLYYLCILEVGAFAGTALQIRRNASAATLQAVSGKPLLMGAQTGQSDLPAVNSSLTIGTSSQLPFWLGAN